MSDNMMDDNNRGLSPEEIDAIFEKYDNGEISESELIKAIENASTDTNFTDDFSDKFFTDKVNINPNTIREESVSRQSDGVLDDDADDPFNEKRTFDESETSAGSGSGLSKKRDVQKSDNEKNKKPVKKTTKKVSKKAPVIPTSIEEAHADTPADKDNTISKNAYQSKSVPLEDNDEENDRIKIEEDIEDDIDEIVEDEEDIYDEEIDDEEEIDDTSIASPSSQLDQSTPSPFDSPVFLPDDEKKRITPRKKNSRPKSSPFGNGKSNGEDENDKPLVSPFGDPSGIGDNAKNANLGKKKAPNIWAQRFAAITAASQEEYQEETNEDFEGKSSHKHQGKDQTISAPQNKKKSKAPLVLALLLAATMILPIVMLMSGSMSNQVIGSGGVCKDGIDGNDISGKGSRGVPKGKKSNPEIMPPGVLTSGFGLRVDPITGEDASHKGQDIATGGSDVGIYAYYDGVVSVVCRDCNPGGFGSYVTIDHKDDKGEPFTTLYGHMYTKDIFVKEGEKVAAGQKIALQGSNGGSTGPHLHFEVAPGAKGAQHIGKQVDPAPYLKDTMNPTEDGRGSGESNTDNDNSENNDQEGSNDENKSSEENDSSEERSSSTGKGNAEILNEDKLKTNARKVAHIIADRYPEIKTIGGWRPSDPFPDHPSGLALDIMIPDYNTPKGEKLGTEINDFLLDNADKLQTNYTIWRQRSYHLDGSSRGMENRGGDTANHMDHVHVLFNGDGSVVDPGGNRSSKEISGGDCCGAGRASPGEVAGITDDENNPKDVKEVMKTNASTIISVGKDKDMNENSIKSLLVIANKQSGLRNLANKGENFSHTNDGGTNQKDLQKSLDKEHDGITDDSNKLGVFLLPPSGTDSVEDLMNVSYQAGLLFDKIKEKNLQDKNANEIAKGLGLPDSDYEGSMKDIEKYYDDNEDSAEENADYSSGDMGNGNKCESIDQGGSSWNGSGKINGDSDVPDDLIPIFNEAAKEAKNDFITPSLLAAIAYTENGFKNSGCSGAGACGMMQFMPAAWETYGEGGLENRNDPKKAVKAAVKHLDANYEMISGWKKAGRFSGNEDDIIESSIAGYNGGPAYADKNFSGGCGVKPDDKPGCWPSESEQYVHKVKDAMEKFSE